MISNKTKVENFIEQLKNVNQLLDKVIDFTKRDEFFKGENYLGKDWLTNAHYDIVQAIELMEEYVKKEKYD